MSKVQWISRELAMAIHNRQLAEHGGEPGVRDADGFVAAVEAPVLNKSKPDVYLAAATYAAEIVTRRPFVGGNKRTALAVARTFLSLNHVEPAASREARCLGIQRLAYGQSDAAEFAQVLRGKNPTGDVVVAGKLVSDRRTVMSYQCSRCGCTDAEPGSIASTGRLYFRPTNSKFLTMKTANIEVKANACTGCGHVDFVADVGKLNTLTARAEPV